MKRNQNVDILRGIATIAVIIGHAIQRGLVINYSSNLLFKFIYAFHMPLFIFLSGYTLFISNPKYDKKFIWKKIKRLLFPLIIWSYIMFFVKDFTFVGIKPFIQFPDSIIEYSKFLIFHPDMIYWFLYILFIYNLIFYIGSKLPKKYFNTFIITIAIVLWNLPISAFGIYWLRIYFPIFVTGYLMGKYKIIIKELKHYIIPAILFIIIYFPTWNPGDERILVTYLLATSIILILCVVIKIIKKAFPLKILSWFGKHSMEFYLCQCLCLNIGIGTNKIRVLTIFISATIISTLLVYITNKFKIIKKLLYGVS